MADRQAQSLRNPSRTAAKIAVVVLIVIAIAGFVLAGLRGRTPAAGQAAGTDATPEAAAPLTAAVPAASAPAEEAADAPNVVAFAPASANLSEKESAKVRTMADTAKKKNHRIEIVSMAEAGPAEALARQRVAVVRQTLEQGGIPLGRMTIRVSTVPLGTVSVAESNRVEMVLR